MSIEGKIILGLLAVAIMGILFSVPLRLLEKKFEKKKNTAIGIYALGWLVFYVAIIWYWINLLGEVEW